MTGKVRVGKESQGQLTAVANPFVINEKLENLYWRPAYGKEKDNSKEHFDGLIERKLLKEKRGLLFNLI